MMNGDEFWYPVFHPFPPITRVPPEAMRSVASPKHPLPDPATVAVTVPFEIMNDADASDREMLFVYAKVWPAPGERTTDDPGCSFQFANAYDDPESVASPTTSTVYAARLLVVVTLNGVSPTSTSVPRLT